MSDIKVPSFDNPITKNEVEDGTGVITYAIAPSNLDFSDDRDPSFGLIKDWNDDKSKVLIEYGPFLDTIWVPREKVKLKENKKSRR